LLHARFEHRRRLGRKAFQGTGGGVFRTLSLSRYATMNLDILRRFLDLEIGVENKERDDCLVKIERPSILSPNQ
jgi:hypothetical protein